MSHRLLPLLVTALGAAACTPPRRPDVVLISFDTTRRDHLDLYGYQRATSGAIRELAEGAVVFEQAIAAHTNTGPSHTSILSGLHPISHGALNNGVHVGSDVPLLAEVLRVAGYTTAAFVSGATMRRSATGLERGFELYDDRMGEHERRAADTIDAALAWLEQHRDDDAPFFLFVHLFDPHHIYDAPAPFAQMFRAPEHPTDLPVRIDFPRIRSGDVRPNELAEYVRRYDAEIAYADHHARRLLGALAGARRFDGAVVVALADHGETTTERPWLFDHGDRVTDEQVRVPLVIKLPGGRLAGRRVASQVRHVDVVPTIMQAVGLSWPEALPGASLLPIAAGDEPERDRPAITLARHVPKRLLEYRLPVAPEQRDFASLAGIVIGVRLPPFKLVSYPGASGQPVRQLFDLAHDPHELSDCMAQLGEAAAPLAAELQRYLAERHRQPHGDAPSAETMQDLRSLGYVQ